MDSESEYEEEEWLPCVLKRWNALIVDPKYLKDTQRDGKKYSAFLRFVFKSYDIDATARIRKGRNRHYDIYTLKIEYTGQVRTIKQLKTRCDEIREIVRAFEPTQCDVEYDYFRGQIEYSPLLIWERNPRNGSE